MEKYSTALNVRYQSFSLPMPVGPSSAVSAAVALIYPFGPEEKMEIQGFSVRIAGKNFEKVDIDQLWYWTPGWQMQEQEAEIDVERGDFEDFNTMEEFVGSLRKML